MDNRTIFVSPGAYTSETDLSFVTSSVGITTLGVVGETLKGPAFEVVPIKNHTEFRTRFGGQSTEKFANGVPKYELPYIANSYLQESNQLYVTRVLGLSGYNSGKAYLLKVVSNYDASTKVAGTAVSGTTTFTGNTFGNSSIEADKALFGKLPITALNSGSTFTVAEADTVVRYGTNSFSGYSLNMTVTTFNGTSGTANFVKTPFTATANAEMDNIVVGVLRSRGTYDQDTLNFATSSAALSGFNKHLASAPFTIAVNGSKNYTVSLNQNSQDYISKVFGDGVRNNVAELFVEDLYSNLINKLITENLIYDVTLVENTTLNNYKTQYKTPETPWIVSELRGNVVTRLFKAVSISDGDSANREVKISFQNINLDTREFDVIVRDFNDTDANPVVLESFPRCGMNPAANNFVGKRIGSTDGLYILRSSFIMLEIDENAPVDAVPSGFEGYVYKNFGAGIKPAASVYKTSYLPTDKVKKTYLGLSDKVGIDASIFNYHGENIATGTTKGFHLDSGASATDFVVGPAQFRSESGVVGTAYESVSARKFTVAPAGGFDGWDIYRTVRTNGDVFRKTQPRFSAFTETLLSDYYAYSEAIKTFNNPTEININLFATAGIDYDKNNALVKETIEMIEEERSDSLYIVNSPDQSEDKGVGEAMVDILESADIDSSYTATYGPWVLHTDGQNGLNVYLPPTFEVLQNIAYTDNTKAPWFGPAGFQRGVIKSKKAKNKINQEDFDKLSAGRINPIRTYAGTGLVIFGQRTLQVKESATDRINVRRLLLHTRKVISNIAIRLVFEQHDEALRKEFIDKSNPVLQTIKQQRGLHEFKIVMDETLNTPDVMDRNEMRGYIIIKPTKAAEKIIIGFGVTSQGASFDNI